MMNFKFFIEKGQAKKSFADKNLVNSLVEQTKKDLKFFEDIKINELSSRKLVSNYYDFLRTILEAVSLTDSYKIYGHEVFTYYLIEKNEHELSRQFERFRKIRNGINYYGSLVSVKGAEEIIKEIKKMINYLIQKYLK